MEQSTHHQILERIPEELPNPEMARWIEAINRHKETGEDQYLYLGYNNDKALAQFITLIGQEAVSSRQVLGYAYRTMTNEHLEKQGSRLKFSGERSIIQLEDWLGDFGVNLEFVNDFQTKLFVELDKETMILYEHETGEDAVVCDDCAGKEEYGMDRHNQFYSCEHHQGEYNYTFNNSAHIMKRLGRKAIVSEGLLNFFL